MSELDYKVGELQVTQVFAKPRKLDFKYVLDEVQNYTMQGPSTGVVHPSAKRATDRRKATIWKRLRG